MAEDSSSLYPANSLLRACYHNYRSQTEQQNNNNKKGQWQNEQKTETDKHPAHHSRAQQMAFAQTVTHTKIQVIRAII